MPMCRHCARTLASCDVRKTPLGHVCKDKTGCARTAAKDRAARADRSVAS